MTPKNYLFNNIQTIIKVINDTSIIPTKDKNDIIDCLYNLNYSLATKGPFKDYAHSLLEKWNENFSDEESYFFNDEKNEPIASLVTSEGYYKIYFKNRETAIKYEFFKEYIKSIGFGYYSADKTFRRKRFLNDDMKYSELCELLQLKFNLNKQILRQL